MQELSEGRDTGRHHHSRRETHCARHLRRQTPSSNSQQVQMAQTTTDAAQIPLGHMETGSQRLLCQPILSTPCFEHTTDPLALPGDTKLGLALLARPATTVSTRRQPMETVFTNGTTRPPRSYLHPPRHLDRVPARTMQTSHSHTAPRIPILGHT